MSALASLQQDMLAGILDEDRPLPEGWTARHAAGLAIYRNNYRSALVEALQSTFERTAKLVGKESFGRAAAHHVILHPPTGWTLDQVGDGFDATCAELFAQDPEVAELAWLEWAMHCAFVARDVAPLDRAQFAQRTQDFADDDWTDLRLRVVPGLAWRAVSHDLKALWSQGETAILADPASCVVWREGERPTFLLLAKAEGEALVAMAGGASFGEACALLAERLGEEEAIAAAGTMLGRWLAEGFLEAIA